MVGIVQSYAGKEFKIPLVQGKCNFLIWMFSSIKRENELGLGY